MGAAGAFAPVNFKHWVHAPALKRVVELESDTKVRKAFVYSKKLQKLMLITCIPVHFISLGTYRGDFDTYSHGEQKNCFPVL